MRFRRALIAALGVLAGAPGARADEPRDAFGLPPRPAEPRASCGDGLAPDCAMATDPLDEATPYGLATWLPGSYLRRLPVGDATHDAVASYALGVGRDEAGLVIGGASGLENRWTIDGAPADNIRTGAVDTRVPLAFLDGIMVSAGGFSARDRASTGGAIDARLRRGTADHEVSAEAWTSLSRAATLRPSASGSFTVRKLTAAPGPSVSAAVVATGPLTPLAPLVGGTAWYAAGIAPRLAATSVRWHAVRTVDADGDGIPDGLPGDVAAASIEDTETRELDYTVPVMARVGLDRGPHQLALSLIGHVARDSLFLGNATMQAAGIDRRTATGDAIATWRGSWPDVRARLQLSWHRGSQVESARDPAAADIPQLLSAYVPIMLPEDPALAAACDDTSPLDPARNIVNCPVPFGFFASGGAGPLIDLTGDRPTATGDVTVRLGDHVVRAGGALEDTRLVTTTSFTGNEQQRSLFPGERSHRRFYTGTCIDDVAMPCDVTTASQLTYRTVYAAIYAEDTFTLMPGLSIDAGLRGELMWVGTRLHFSSELAPRAGVVWDVLGGGRSRLWASYGRSFAMLPAGLGTTVIQRDATVEDFELGPASGRVHDAGSAFLVEPRVRPITQDEVTLGAQVVFTSALRATLWGQGRWLRHGLETTAEAFENPGGHGDIAATRETEVVALEVEVRRPATVLRAGVMWGRTVGSWAGPFDPRQGANFLQGADWDADASNLYGPLPTNLGGRVFAEAERRATLGEVELAVATRLTAASGRPRNALANGIDGIVELLPRGSAGDNPVVTQINLRVAARWRGVDVTLDVFNLFDRRDVTNLDEIYSDDLVRPISGGSASDLVFLKSEDGSAAHRRTAFQLPLAYQAPLSAALGVHKAF
ncbi:MAG: TonB-dependent receptor [Deltaproteobacteria bacterium]|nr:MAG: TonB-dependent receptor [Deltaproteobacteria bacterium]